MASPEEQKKIPLNMLFRNLKTDEAFVRVRDYVNGLIDKEKDDYFEVEEKGENDSTLKDIRLKIKHYKELWKKVGVFIDNSSRE